MEKKAINKVFIIRLIVWTVFAAILPVAFIAWRFRIFENVSGVSLTGWGIIAIIILAVFLLTVAKYLKKGLPFSMFTQCVNGFIKVILPLSVLLLVVYNIGKNAQIMEQALCCVIICETIAIPVNPFPKWMFDNNIELDGLKMDMFIGKLTGAKDAGHKQK